METKSKAQKWIIWGIPVLFIVGALFHFLYDFTKEFFLIGLIAPVNESVWEHTKLFVFPIIIWWLAFYFKKHDSFTLNKKKWLAGMLTSLVTTMLMVPVAYYFYTNVFGTSLLWVDILISLIAIGAGQLFGLHVYNHSKGISKGLAFLILFVIIAITIWFTLSPPKLPVFLDSVSKTYGIYKTT